MSNEITVITDPKVYFMGAISESPNAIIDSYKPSPWNGVRQFMDDYGYDPSSRPLEECASTFAEELVEIDGRLCYMSFKPESQRPGGNPAYIKNIIESGHGAVLEHATYSFIFAGVSRTLTHELVRHRVGVAYSQLSQRYVDSKDVAFVLPHEYKDQREEIAIWHQLCVEALAAYNQLAEVTLYRLKEDAYAKWKAAHPTLASFLVKDWWMSGLTQTERTEYRKRARQSARSVLPGCAETKIAVTANARTLRHWLESRSSKFAEPEIRKLMNVLLPILKAHSPNIFGDYETNKLPDGTFEIITPHKKV